MKKKLIHAVMNVPGITKIRAHQMEPPSPTQALGVNPFPSRFIERRRFRVLIKERANENRETTAGGKRIHAIQAHYRRKILMVLFITLLGKGLTQEINGDGSSI